MSALLRRRGRAFLASPRVKTVLTGVRHEQKEQAWDFFAIRRTICQMLADRSYNLPPEDADDFTFEVRVGRRRLHARPHGETGARLTPETDASPGAPDCRAASGACAVVP